MLPSASRGTRSARRHLRRRLRAAPLSNRTEFSVGTAWRCPGCRTTIQHAEKMPRFDVVYRCHICRLEFVVDVNHCQLTLAAKGGTRRDDTPTSPTHHGTRKSAEANRALIRRSGRWHTNQNDGMDAQTTSCGCNAKRDNASGIRSRTVTETQRPSHATYWRREWRKHRNDRKIFS